MHDVHAYVQLAVMKRKVGGRAPLVQAVADSLKAEYEDFDDYIEMAIQFGCGLRHAYVANCRRYPTPLRNF